MQIVQISVKFHIFNVPAFPIKSQQQRKKWKPINFNLMFQSDGMIEIVPLIGPIQTTNHCHSGWTTLVHGNILINFFTTEPMLLLHSLCNDRNIGK